MKLHVSPKLSFPPEAVTETFGILAARGAGKTNTAVVMAEEMFRAKLPFVAIDPVRAWWGLRSSRNGKGAGLPIPIFGGRHGDVPLERTSGQFVARLIVSERLSCVLDVSEWESEAAKKQFLLDFARELYQRNEAPLHLFLEEADDYIPQRPMRDEAVLLRAWENIVRRGRSRGLGCTLITQRSASLNKNVLTQVQTLIPMRTTGPQDIKAIHEWVHFHRQSDELLESLPGLANGEAWVWSPYFLKTMKRVTFRRRATFDSGATPKVSTGHRKPATLADVNLDRIKKQMAATIEKAKAEDPKELRRMLAEAKAQLAKKERVLVEVDQRTKKIDKSLGRVKPPKRVEVPIIKATDVNRLERSLIKLEKLSTVARESAVRVHEALVHWAQIQSRNVAAVAFPDRKPVLPSVAHFVSAKLPGRVRFSEPPDRPEQRVRQGRDPRVRIVNALAWWESAGVEQPTRHQAAFVAGYTVNGHFNNMVGSLRTDGLIEYPGDGTLQLTETGRRQAAPVTESPDRDALIVRVREVLRKEPLRRIFDTLATYKNPVPREQLAEACGYTVNGHFNNMVGSLRSLGVAKYPGDGSVALSDLFDMV